MKFHKKSLVAICLCFFMTIALSVQARKLKTYQGNLSVPILENDAVFARNKAFQTLQSLLLSAAIQDLIGYELYEAYKFDISKNKDLLPSEFLVSAKVLEERREGGDFLMKLEGKIETDALSDALKDMNLILKTDPWFPVDILVESGIDLSEEAIKHRLSLFHVRISSIKRVNLENFAWDERDKAEFIEALSQLFANSKVLYLIDSIPGEEEGSVKSLRNQIFRLKDKKQIGVFQLNLPTPVELTSVESTSLKSFLKLYDIQSLATNLYNEGTDSILTIKVEGLLDQYTRQAFEDEMLDGVRAIKAYSLTMLSEDTATYEIQSTFSYQELESYFKKGHPDFYFITEKLDSQSMVVESFFRYQTNSSALKEWQSNDRLLEMIRETFTVTDQDGEDQTSRSIFQQTEDDSLYVPQWVEREPNNNSTNLNSLPEDSLVLGYISSRADEDLFQIKRTVDSSKLLIEWTRVGKTTLSPQLRLYDHQLNFLKDYQLTLTKDRIKIQYDFKQDTPHKVVVRIADKVGFIQGETGGFKSYYYLLKCRWITDESDLVSSVSLY